MRSHFNKIVLTGLTCILLAPGVSFADLRDSEHVKIETEINTSIGYRSVSEQGEPSRAAEYKSLDSGPTLDLHFFKAFEDFTLGVDGTYLGEDEYSTTANLNANSQIRLFLRSQRFVHNLEHIPYANGMTGDWEVRVAGPIAEGSRADDSVGRRIYFSDHNPGDDYQLRLDVNEVKARIKAPTYPAHLNLSYWSYEKHGNQQLRFINHRGTSPTSGSSCTGCHLQSKSRTMDTKTEEVKASLDTHLGYVDLILETLYRTFRDMEDTPTDGFRLSSTYGGWNPSLPHDENPNSTLTETSIKLNTAPAGGFVASGSYTIGRRENRSDLLTEAPIDAETDYKKATVDLNYTPDQMWTYNLRYRHLDMDNSNTSELSSYAGVAVAPGSLLVRDAIDTSRDWYEGTVIYRPTPTVSVRGELMREDIHRGYDAADPWDLPKYEVKTRAKLGFYSRHLPKSALKLRGWAAYLHDSAPAYGNSAEKQKELFLSANYSAMGNWGMSASYNLSDEENNRHDIQLEYNDAPGTFEDFDLNRKQLQHNATLGGWVNLARGVTLDASYGFFRTSIEQDLLFGNSPSSADATVDYAFEDEGVDFRQTVHTLRAGVSWQPLEHLNCRLEGYHIRSEGYMSPDFYVDGLVQGVMSSADLREISAFDIRQNGLRGTLKWQIDDNWSCAAEMTYDDYDEKASDIYDGSVVATMFSVSRTW